MKKILLLNPPWKNNRLSRDYYCGHTSKGSYLQPPLDFLIISGILAEKHEVLVLDCIAKKLSYEKAFKEILRIKPEFIISLTSAISFKDDMGFLKSIKDSLKCQIILVGDIAYFEYDKIMKEYDFIDCVLLDFTSFEILRFIDSDLKDLKDIAYRAGKKVIFCGKSDTKKFSIPLPKHELFPLKKYSLPYNYEHPMSSTITTYGCPYRCSFCAFGKLPYKEREIENVIEELKYLERIGIKEINFKDYTFNGNVERCKKLCKEIIRNKISLKWSCEAAAINSDIEMLELMKKAGCYLVLVGVESVDNKILKETHKPLNTDLTVKFFKNCKKAGIQTLGHFIFGLPNDNESLINNTIKFSKKLGCDFASFNLYVPRIGSELRNKLIKNHKINLSDLEKFDSSTESIEVSGLSREKLVGLRNKAIREFYFRPSQIMKQISFIKSKTRLICLIKNGVQVFFDIVLKKKKV